MEKLYCAPKLPNIWNLIRRLFLTAAYKHADGKKIDGRRVLVDVERARTVKGNAFNIYNYTFFSRFRLVSIVECSHDISYLFIKAGCRVVWVVVSEVRVEEDLR